MTFFYFILFSSRTNTYIKNSSWYMLLVLILILDIVSRWDFHRRHILGMFSLCRLSNWKDICWFLNWFRSFTIGFMVTCLVFFFPMKLLFILAFVTQSFLFGFNVLPVGDEKQLHPSKLKGPQISVLSLFPLTLIYKPSDLFWVHFFAVPYQMQPIATKAWS